VAGFWVGSSGVSSLWTSTTPGESPPDGRLHWYVDREGHHCTPVISRLVDGTAWQASPPLSDKFNHGNVDGDLLGFAVGDQTGGYWADRESDVFASFLIGGTFSPVRAATRTSL
jgi:hypothetical protein